MDTVNDLLGFVLHVDRHLSDSVLAYGGRVYALLFVIIFVETGLVVMPFLPGDSLLFVVGALCGAGSMSLQLSVLLLKAAAILGDQTNYSIRRNFGPKVFGWPNSRWFNRDAFNRTHAFYEQYGGILWLCGLTLAGYVFGNPPWVKAHLSAIIWSMIALPGLAVVVGAWRSSRNATQGQANLINHPTGKRNG